MAESTAHQRAKRKAAGKTGETEVSLSRNRRLDAATERRATEVERSGNPGALVKAAERLRDSGKAQRVLQVPHHDMAKAVHAMKTAGVGGSVKNMGGTKRRSVSGKK